MIPREQSKIADSDGEIALMSQLLLREVTFRRIYGHRLQLDSWRHVSRQRRSACCMGIVWGFGVAYVGYVRLLMPR